MKRRVIQLVLLLIAGAIVNVAVAWGLAESGAISHTGNIEPNTRPINGFAPVLLVYETYSYRAEMFVPRNKGMKSFTHWKQGWPFRSMSASSSWSDGSYVWTDSVAPNGKLHPWAARPIWPGFAINTIFYTAILWVLFFVSGKLKRTLRRRRGLCPACAYPVGTSPVCTECGKQLA